MGLFDTMRRIPFIAKQAQALHSSLTQKVDIIRARAEFHKRLAACTEEGRILTQDQEAILFAQSVQLQFLKSPQTAIFPDIDEFSIETKDDNLIVSGHVDAQNSYGGMMRDKFQIMVSFTADGWEYRVDPMIALKTVCVGYISAVIILILIIFVYA